MKTFESELREYLFETRPNVTSLAEIQRIAIFAAKLHEKHSTVKLREHYAGLAMQGILANPNYKAGNGIVIPSAFEYADAMIAQSKEVK